MKRLLAKLAACAVAVGILASCAGVSNPTEQKGVSNMTDMARKALTLAGFDMERFDESNPRVSERILMDATHCLEDSLAAKYPGVVFELTSCAAQEIDQPYFDYTLQTTQPDCDPIVARVRTTGDGYVCTDSYYGAAKAGEYASLVKSAGAAIEPDAQAFSTLYAQFGGEVTLDAPLENVLKRGDLLTYTWILLPPGGAAFGARAAAIRGQLAAKGLTGDFSVYLLTAQAAASPMTRKEAFERIPGDASTHLVWSEYTRFIDG